MHDNAERVMMKMRLFHGKKIIVLLLIDDSPTDLTWRHPPV